MKKKSSLMFFVVISLSIIFSLSLVYATCSNDDQIILRLSDATNAHGEVYNGAGGYTEEICYDTIFGVGARGTSCTSGNGLVLRLSALTNAHAEVNTLSTYQTKVCYGNLNCRSASSCDTSKGEKFIVALSALTNAHLSTSSSDIAYPFRICCKETEGLSKPYWGDTSKLHKNLPGDEISTTDKGDAVLAVATGQNIEGQTINFEIWRKDIGFDNKITNKTTIAKKDADEGEFAYIAWRPTEKGNYYIKANIQGSTDIEISDNLEVSDIEENTPPVANITQPEYGQINITAQNIQFSHDSRDIDDSISAVEWDFGDNTPTSNLNSPNHIYTQPGQYTITLKVTDSRGLLDTDMTSILIVECAPQTTSTYFVFAGILEPEWNEVFSYSTIDFDASLSYVIECDTAGALSCKKGNCPPPNTPASPDWLDVSFSWVFDKPSGTKDERVTEYNIQGSGPHTTRLTATYSSISSSTYTEFILDIAGEGYCTEEGWVIDNSLTSNCYNSRAEDPYCCPSNPSGYSCVLNPLVPDTGTCEFTGETMCEDYKPANYDELDTTAKQQVQDRCIADPATVAISDVESRLPEGRKCGESFEKSGIWWIIENCKCKWGIPSGDTTESCYPIWELIQQGKPGTTGTCSYSNVQKGECIAGQRLISWKAICDPEGACEESCEDGSRTFPCLSEALFGFFGTFSIISIIIVFILFYLFRIKIQNSKKIKK